MQNCAIWRMYFDNGKDLKQILMVLYTQGTSDEPAPPKTLPHFEEL